jgi:hypothetical protein
VKAGSLAATALTLLAAGCAGVADRAPAPPTPSAVSRFSANPPGAGTPRGWEIWRLSRFKKPTRYELVSEGGRTVVAASADASASGLVHRLKLDPRSHPLLSWRWKVEALIARADNTRRRTEDSPVRVMVSFDGDLERLPLDERLFFDNIRVLTGQRLPYATLMYIWENRVPSGTVIPNRHTSRIRMIVAGSGRNGVGAWQDLTRNVYDDYQRAFGEKPGHVTAVGIMTDTDNTGAVARAWYGDIRFRAD